MSGLLTPDARLRVFDDTGVVLPGALLYSYVAGSLSTPLATYSDSALLITNSNPVEASAGGLFGPIYLTPGTAYQFLLKDADGVTVPGWPQDNVMTPAVNTLSAGTGISIATVSGVSTITNTVTSTPSGVVTLVDGATPALDASLGAVFSLTALGDRTIAIPTNPTSGQKIVIRHLASGGARTLALNSGAGGFRFGTDITALTQTASGKIDYIGCIYNLTATFWDVVAVVKGF